MADEKIYLGNKTQVTEIGDADTFIIVNSAGIRQITKVQLVEKLGINSKADKADLVNSVTFKGSDTTANITAKTDAAIGDKWYSTDDNVYYVYSSSGWINCGSGENLKLIEEQITELKDDLISLSQQIANQQTHIETTQSIANNAVQNKTSYFLLSSPNGTLYKIYVSDNGVLTVGEPSEDEMLDDLLTGRILAWHDEFETFDTDVWTHEIGYVRNNEIQYYSNSSENSYEQNSILHLVALKNSPADGYDWSSASILTRNKYAFYRGLIETKMRISPNVGIWPAFWAKGDSYYATFNPLTSLGEKWPQCAEVDVCELVGAAPTMKPGVFWYDDLLESQKNTNAGASVAVDDNWHIYGWERTDTEFNFYLDRTLVGSIDISTLEYAEELNRAMYIQFNIAVGGGAVGNPEDTLTRSTCEIDWVRAYLPVDATEIVEPTIALDCGNTFKLNANKIRYLRPIWSGDNGSNYAIEWKSSDPTVATVYGGKVSAIKAGTCNIIATAANGNAASAALTVGESVTNLCDTVIIKGAPDSLDYDNSIALTALVWPEWATNRAVVWESSDSTIATITDDGIVTAVAKDGGVVTIICKSQDGGATANVSIKCNTAVIIDSIDTTNIIAKYTRNGFSTDNTWTDDTGNCPVFDFTNMSYDTSYKMHFDSPYGYYGRTAITRTQSIKPTNYFAVCDTPGTFTVFCVFYYLGTTYNSMQGIGAFTDGSSAFTNLTTLRNGYIDSNVAAQNGYNYVAITYDGATATVYSNSIDNGYTTTIASKEKIALTGYGQSFGNDDISGFLVYDGIKSTDEISSIFASLKEMYES